MGDAGGVLEPQGVCYDIVPCLDSRTCTDQSLPTHPEKMASLPFQQHRRKLNAVGTAKSGQPQVGVCEQCSATDLISPVPANLLRTGLQLGKTPIGTHCHDLVDVDGLWPVFQQMLYGSC